jgi:hypothetical protein
MCIKNGHVKYIILVHCLNEHTMNIASADSGHTIAHTPKLSMNALIYTYDAFAEPKRHPDIDALRNISKKVMNYTRKFVRKQGLKKYLCFQKSYVLV